MGKLLVGIIVAVFIALVLGDGGEKHDREKRLTIEFQTLQQFLQTYCQGNVLAPLAAICNVYSTTTNVTPSITTTYPSSSSDSSSTTAAATTSSTTQSPSALQNAHWCSFSNGTYIALGYTFMYTTCALCQCTQSHVIRCTTLQCAPTYCIDNSAPSLREGQCCSQCAYEPNATACIVNGIAFPHGTLLRETTDQITCWCELGTVECRKFSTSLFAGLNFWGEGTVVYVIVIIVCVMLILGTLVCSGGTLFFYHYYKRSQQATQEAYEHYYNSAGWQEMGEDGQVVDPSAEEKKAEAEAEAEQNQYEYAYPTGNSEQYIPPPYALYNGSYVNEQTEKEEKST